MTAPQNMVGTRVKGVRREKGLTQAMLAAKCALLGWDVSENILTKIETQIRCVTDFELACIAKALGVSPEILLPGKEILRAEVVRYFSRRS